MAGEVQLAEEKSKKAMLDAARMADELRQEQECTQMIGRGRKLRECQLKDSQQHLDEAEMNVTTDDQTD